MYTWQPLWGIDGLRTRVEINFQTPLNCLPTHCHGPMSMHYVLFGHGGNLLRHHVHVLKDPPIPFLPKVRHDVYANSIEASAFLFWHLVCRMLPPGGKCGRILLRQLQGEILPSQH